MERSWGGPGAPRSQETRGPWGGWVAPPAEAGHGADGAFRPAGTGCDLDMTLDSWKNHLKVPLAGLLQDLL